jgi:PPP family 3-phenylpropionic acid transporter
MVLNRQNLSLSALQLLFWSALVSVFGFLVLYLKELGYTEFQIGIVVTCISLFKIAAQPLWGYLCDLLRNVKAILAICMAIAIGAALLFPAFSDVFPVVVLLSSLLAATYQTIPTVLDGWIVRIKKKHPEIDYGKIRSLGSLGVAVTAAVAGRLFVGAGLSLMFYLFSGLVLFTIVSLFAVDDRRIWEKKKTPHLKAASVPIAVLFKNRGYVFFLVIATLIWAAQRAAISYYPLLLSQRGGTSEHLGYSLFVMTASEIPILIFADKIIKKIGVRVLLLISFVFFGLKFFLHLVAPSPVGLIFVQALQGLSYAVFLPASVYFIHGIALEENQTVAQTIAGAAYLGVGGVLGSFFGSLLIEKYGILMLYKAATVLAIFCTVFYIAAVRIGMRRTCE